MGWQDSVVCGDPSVVGWEDPGHFFAFSFFLFFCSSFVGWEHSVVGWEDSMVGWKDSVLGWEILEHMERPFV